MATRRYTKQFKLKAVKESKKKKKKKKKKTFKYVLTGTPIPNSYQDIYNFLHILYNYEYNSFFGWEVGTLKNPKIREIQEINKTMHPFFWRTNKNDLNVPKPEKDIIIEVLPSEEQLSLAEDIYFNEKSSLARLIRLMQASTNPALLESDIKYDELMCFDEDEDDNTTAGISEEKFNKLLGGYNNSLDKYSTSQMISPKFIAGIKLIRNLVEEGKKVLVWGIFIDTMLKITTELE